MLYVSSSLHFLVNGIPDISDGAYGRFQVNVADHLKVTDLGGGSERPFLWTRDSWNGFI